MKKSITTKKISTASLALASIFSTCAISISAMNNPTEQTNLYANVYNQETDLNVWAELIDKRHNQLVKESHEYNRMSQLYWAQEDDKKLLNYMKKNTAIVNWIELQSILPNKKLYEIIDKYNVAFPHIASKKSAK